MFSRWGFKFADIEYLTIEYIKNGTLSAGYYTLTDLLKDLDSLNREEWLHLDRLIAHLHPKPDIERYYNISDQIPQIKKESAIAGLIGLIFIYYKTQSIVGAIIGGALIAAVAFTHLSEHANIRVTNARTLTLQRMDNIVQHNRFFISRNSQPNLRDRQAESESNQHSTPPTSAAANRV